MGMETTKIENRTVLNNGKSVFTIFPGPRQRARTRDMMKRKEHKGWNGSTV